jgi:ABC-2 type transport system permease protein
MKKSFIDNLRIIWAITAKDMVDALKNKNVIGVLVPALLVVVLYHYLPAITAEDGPPVLRVYDAGQSEVITLLEDSPAVQMYAYESEAELLARLREDEVPVIALVLPADFDARLATGMPPALQAYVLHWLPEADVSLLRNATADELEYLLETPIEINVEAIPLDSESYGITVMQIMGMVFVSLMIGMTAVPHMMLEEKQTKTIDALLISPANSGHVVIGKALTGLVYAYTCLLVAMLVNRVLIEHWWLALVAGFLLSLFAVSLGLLLGILIENRQQLMLWAWVVILPLFLPLMLVLLEELFPAWLIAILRWVPSTATFQALRISMAHTISPDLYLPQLLSVAASALVVLALDAWAVRRMDR